MDIESFRERTSWKVVVIITIILVTFAAAVYGIVMGRVGEHPWLWVQCEGNLVTEFQVENVSSAEQARSLASSIIKVDDVKPAKFQYCGGYAIISENAPYFLCSDGRLYELVACERVKQNETMLPILPDPHMTLG